MNQGNNRQAEPTIVCGELTLTELCRICHVEVTLIDAMLSEGIVEALDVSGDEPRFSEHALWRVSVATRLQRDLEVNLAGAALALDLLEEIERLRRKLGGL